MDTTALAVIVGHWRRLVAAGGAFPASGRALYPYVKALQVTGLADRLPMYDTVDEALADDLGARRQAPEQVSRGASPKLPPTSSGGLVARGTSDRAIRLWPRRATGN